jgi:hypothetical protein
MYEGGDRPGTVGAGIAAVLLGIFILTLTRLAIGLVFDPGAGFTVLMLIMIGLIMLCSGGSLLAGASRGGKVESWKAASHMAAEGLSSDEEGLFSIRADLVWADERGRNRTLRGELVLVDRNKPSGPYLVFLEVTGIVGKGRKRIEETRFIKQVRKESRGSMGGLLVVTAEGVDGSPIEDVYSCTQVDTDLAYRSLSKLVAANDAEQLADDSIRMRLASAKEESPIEIARDDQIRRRFKAAVEARNDFHSDFHEVDPETNLEESLPRRIRNLAEPN